MHERIEAKIVIVVVVFTVARIKKERQRIWESNFNPLITSPYVRVDATFINIFIYIFVCKPAVIHFGSNKMSSASFSQQNSICYGENVIDDCNSLWNTLFSLMQYYGRCFSYIISLGERDSTKPFDGYNTNSNIVSNGKHTMWNNNITKCQLHNQRPIAYTIDMERTRRAMELYQCKMAK